MTDSASPIGCLGRVSRAGAIRPGRVGEGIGEIMNQVISQAGPALDLARQTLGAGRSGVNGRVRRDADEPPPAA